MSQLRAAIERQYLHHCITWSDIHEHLPTLRTYASMSPVVTEMGVREVCSTWALLAALPSKLTCYDTYRHSNVDKVAGLASETNTQFSFIQADVLTVDIEPTDLLFIDTYHVYRQLKAELARHADNVRSWIILHDTETYGETGEDGGPGLLPAIREFLSTSPMWRLHEVFTNNNGLTVLKRIGA